jgi:hypothetical protein
MKKVTTGTYIISAEATDKVGNIASTSIVVTKP